MFGVQDLALFVVTALVVNATPGADFLYTVTRTLRHGWRGGVAAALGISSGCIVHALAAALGLAALLAASSWAFTVIKWVGAIYLLWLAWGMLRAARLDAPSTEAADLHQSSLVTIYAQGFLTNVLNPKVALFFLALLPQFIAPDAPDKPLAFLFLGAVFVVNGTAFLLALVALAQGVRRFGANATVRRTLNLVGASLFASLAVRLAVVER
jgi:threonine/homoserine/homoserine lactone efflux protein